jgi:hypothetical protein
MLPDLHEITACAQDDNNHQHPYGTQKHLLNMRNHSKRYRHRNDNNEFLVK